MLYCCFCCIFDVSRCDMTSYADFPGALYLLSTFRVWCNILVNGALILVVYLCFIRLIINFYKVGDKYALLEYNILVRTEEFYGLSIINCRNFTSSTLKLVLSFFVEKYCTL